MHWTAYKYIFARVYLPNNDPKHTPHRVHRESCVSYRAHARAPPARNGQSSTSLLSTRTVLLIITINNIVIVYDNYYTQQPLNTRAPDRECFLGRVLLIVDRRRVARWRVWITAVRSCVVVTTTTLLKCVVCIYFFPGHWLCRLLTRNCIVSGIVHTISSCGASCDCADDSRGSVRYINWL